MQTDLKQGVLLVNLGTPEAPTAAAVKQFLSQFLHDKRVVDMSRLLWCPILHGIILPRRAPKVAKLYQTVWLEDGSPLMVYSQRQAALLTERLKMPVALGMTYGNPNVQSGIEVLQKQGVDKIIVLPLFPQYSATTTGAASDALSQFLREQVVIPSFAFIRDYHNHSAYIQALADSIRQHWQLHGQGDYLLCSYHGIPQRYADNGDIYPQHCEKTTELLAQALGLSADKIGFSYQSRFGREPWLQPYTDEVISQLPKQGIDSIDVITPAFSADCLETLEEVAIQFQEIYRQAGGQKFSYIPCLNDNAAHIEMMAELVLSH